MSKGPFLKRPSKVGDYKPNRFGIYDMHGNVYEWCEDWYDKDYYATSPMKDPTGPETGVYRVRRGGGWRNYGGWICRASDRSSFVPTNRFQTVGFRVFAPVLSVKWVRTRNEKGNGTASCRSGMRRKSGSAFVGMEALKILVSPIEQTFAQTLLLF